MASKRKPVDAFGLSLLDVLSNALGGLILLVLIVAVTLRGNDKRRLNQPKEDSQGKVTSIVNSKIKAVSNPDINLLLGQIKFLDEDKKGNILKFSSPQQNCFLSVVKGQKNDLREWFVHRIGSTKDNWEVKLEESYSGSIAIFLTLNERPYCSEIIDGNAIKYPFTLLKVNEQGKEDPEIRIAGKVTCPSTSTK